MLGIMFDPYFMNMKIIWDFVSNAYAIQIVTNYDSNIVSLFIILGIFFIWTLLKQQQIS
jgi:hypothetical protein